ncbi:MAG: DUF4293 family protein [Ginsengibacter sp.]
MIQRVQSMWMILAALAVFLTFQFPFYSGSLVEGNAYATLKASDNFFILILTSAIGTGIIIDIFLFKHRSVQMRITLIAILVECLVIFLYTREIKKFSQGNFSLWSALHLLILIFLVAAAVGIYKDSKLIKESNRLR